MPKIDNRRIILPDVEMYGGSTDYWEICLYDNGGAMSYEDAQELSFSLVVKDYGYIHRESGSTYTTITKSGTVIRNYDGTASVKFQFSKNDTINIYGKYTYQIIAESQELGFRSSAQGTLFITKSID